jgi:hypothetical protein
MFRVVWCHPVIEIKHRASNLLHLPMLGGINPVQLKQKVVPCYCYNIRSYEKRKIKEKEKEKEKPLGVSFYLNVTLSMVDGS